ncbi:hypothetical protein QR680_011119 [Steinernema hermaphroditum]|uniref:Uncharacterized protein n=1 Tax=Steinernema hermaphroditum TaxID=289476 RepID=A0AA39ITN6_9BILA|nr:hypothetical protein QR680_011119 [Steinernema hermaphroditum]
MGLLFLDIVCGRIQKKINAEDRCEAQLSSLNAAKSCGHVFLPPWETSGHALMEMPRKQAPPQGSLRFEQYVSTIPLAHRSKLSSLG